MTDARDIHSGRTNLPKKVDGVSNIPKDVPVTVHPAFQDFYPLHVTKTEQPKSAKMGIKVGKNAAPIIVGILLVILAALAAMWYVMRQQTYTPATSSSSTTSTSSNSIPIVDSTGQTPVSVGYSNAQYGFKLTYPASWANVLTQDITASDTTTTKPLARIAFFLPATAAAGSRTLLTIRVDSADTYKTWQNQLTATPSSQAQLLGKIGTNTVSVESEYKAISGDGATDAFKAAAADLPAVLVSFATN